VVVLARELTLKQVAHITKEIKRRNITGPSGQLIKIEIFVHGALCMAVSGKCYLSLHEQNAAANRGACVQNCRRPYLVKDAETNEELIIDNEYIMSPQDLCTISILDQVLEAGVDVLKIEGRSKGAEYVDTVTSCYKEAAAAVLNNDYTAEKKADWLARLRKVYNRGFWEGYYLGRKLGEWTSEPGSQAEERKIYLGKGTNYYPKIQVGEFLVEAGSLAKGDTVLVLGPELGMAREIMERLVVNGVEADQAAKGDKITFPIATKIGAKDKLYKLIKT
jgi:putative protease